MSNNVDQENSSLTAEEKKIQIIKRITAIIIIIMRAANLADTFIITDFTTTDINNEFSKQFKLKNIEFFNSKLSIEKNIIIISNKL